MTTTKAGITIDGGSRGISKVEAGGKGLEAAADSSGFEASASVAAP
jgi:hypothetical protein